MEPHITSHGNNARMVKNDEVIAQRAGKKKAEASWKRKKTQSPSTTPRTAMSALKGSKEKVGESS